MCFVGTWHQQLFCCVVCVAVLETVCCVVCVTVLEAEGGYICNGLVMSVAVDAHQPIYRSAL